MGVIMQKSAIVTGAARGIGLATTKLFLEEGRRVAMIDRDAEALMEAATGLDNVLPVVCDVSQPDQVAAMAAEVLGQFGQIDALVNNAGVADFGPIDETDFERWRRVMETNLDGAFLCSQACAQALKAASGAIVNIASISGLRASTLRVAYGTSKAGVMHLTQQQAAEWGEFGVRSNCICPGPVATLSIRSRSMWPSSISTPRTERRIAPHMSLSMIKASGDAAMMEPSIPTLRLIISAPAWAASATL